MDNNEININALEYIKLPLYPDPDFSYTTVLDSVAYVIRMFYNTREERWCMDIRYVNNDPIILGFPVVFSYPMYLDLPTPFKGFFLFLSNPREENEAVSNPYEIWKYYDLFYAYDSGS